MIRRGLAHIFCEVLLRVCPCNLHGSPEKVQFVLGCPFVDTVLPEVILCSGTNVFRGPQLSSDKQKESEWKL